jgi:hypothetical protein
MKVGVTGTREGATEYQLNKLRSVLKYLNGSEFHHGDCKGVDEQAAKIAKELGYKIICHPPSDDYLRAFFPYDETRDPAGYLKRDRAIVDECEILLVVPLQEEWQPKGGTWYTHDYAVKIYKPFNIIWPKEKHEDSI